MLAARLGIGHTQLLSEEDYVARVPTANRDGLDGGVLYYDGQFDDARLAIALARTAASLGAVVLNHTACVGIEKTGDRARGLRVRDEEDGAEISVPARVVINATGVWADEVRRMDQPLARPMLEPSRGAHVVLDRAFLPGETAVMVPKTDDGRVLFAIPWLGKTVIGTTDVPVDGPSAEPLPSADEVDYILEHAGRYLTPAPTRADVRAVWAGLRPLISDPDAEGTAALSREHVVSVSASGVVTVTGGKWTTYRVMAEDAVDHAAEAGALETRVADTAELPLYGWVDPASVDPVRSLLRVRRRRQRPARDRLWRSGPRRARPPAPADGHGRRDRVGRAGGAGPHRRGCPRAPHARPFSGCRGVGRGRRARRRPRRS